MGDASSGILWVGTAPQMDCQVRIFGDSRPTVLVLLTLGTVVCIGGLFNIMWQIYTDELAWEMACGSTCYALNTTGRVFLRLSVINGQNQ